MFFRVVGVAYDDLHDVLGNERATHQLETLMKARFCLENLRFLQALDAIQKDPAPEGRRAKLQALFEQWIGDLAPAQVNLSVDTTDGLLALWSSLADEADPASDAALSVLLDQARTQVRRLIQRGPLAELAVRLLELPHRQTASLFESAQVGESGRLLGLSRDS
ncbi:hypothetical protein [Caenimonas sp. SL110]|uniref:hypothetical protein n=1 Tax=Caenimonas sp. SL110 TaxID=1450524 RepID=UPI00128C530F|nr:hypothetical protein [Caenimonas sp. SL110]